MLSKYITEFQWLKCLSGKIDKIRFLCYFIDNGDSKMSDGPLKSMKMRRHWRPFAERVENPACPLKEVCDHLGHALKKDFAEAPVEQVKDILGGGRRQASLFPQEQIAQIEQLRHECPGSAAAKALIDSTVEIVADGQRGDAAVKGAIQNALESYTRDYFRGVEEHCQIEGASAADLIRDRLQATRKACDYDAIASDLATDQNLSGKPSGIEKHSGIDEGPPL
jgi:hypothetical protein